MTYTPPVWLTDQVWYSAGPSQNSQVATILTAASANITAGTDCTAGATAMISACVADHGLFGTSFYFPASASPYEITATVPWYNSTTSTWAGGISILGAGRGASQTTFAVPASTSAFSSAAAPAPVFRTASKYSGTSNPEGEGNEAFANWMSDFLLTVGAGNPGAIGLDFIANNGGGAARLTIQSLDTNGAGYAGLLLSRQYPGPCFFEDLTIIGFTSQVDFGDLGTSGLGWLFGQNRYSITFKNLTLEQMADTAQGVRVSYNMLIVDGLTSSKAGGGAQTAPVIKLNSNQGMVVLINCNFGEGSGVPAIDNSAGGQVYCRNCTGTGWTGMVENPGAVLVPFTTAEYVSGPPLPNAWNQVNTGLNISVPSYPVYNDSSDPPSGWADITTYGASPNTDCTTAINDAMSSGAATVVFPQQPTLPLNDNDNQWQISSPIVVPSTVQRIFFGAGMWLHGHSTYAGDTFTIEPGNTPLFIESYFAGFITDLALTIPAGRPVVFNYVQFAQGVGSLGVYGMQVNPGATVWVKNFIANFYMGKGSTVYAWQLNAEQSQSTINSPTTPYPLGRIWNNGGTLRVVGYKAESNGILCLTDNGGQSEFIGVLQLQEGEAGPPQPAYFVNIGGAHSVVGRFQSDNSSTSPQPGAIFWDIGPATAAQPAGLGYLKSTSCPQYDNGPVINMYSTRLIPGSGGVPIPAPEYSSR